MATRADGGGKKSKTIGRKAIGSPDLATPSQKFDPGAIDMPKTPDPFDQRGVRGRSPKQKFPSNRRT